MPVAAAIDLLVTLLNNSAQISALIQQATSEGRDISPSEWAGIKTADDAARKGLVGAIAAG